jgi:predicted ArsR family transcriptional regulator
VQATRYRILEIIKEQGDVTVAELAQQLDMAPVSVRHHLDVLQGENLIASPRVRRRGTVGRPEQIYVLTEAAEEFFPSNTQNLALGLLDELKILLPAPALGVVFERMADKMAAEATPLPADASMEQRLDNAVKFLNERGYLARWEQDGESFVLFTLNCPYSGVADRHRELCRMDQRLMGQLLGYSPVPITRLSEGGCRCAYGLIDTNCAVAAST